MVYKWQMTQLVSQLISFFIDRLMQVGTRYTIHLNIFTHSRQHQERQVAIMLFLYAIYTIHTAALQVVNMINNSEAQANRYFTAISLHGEAFVQPGVSITEYRAYYSQTACLGTIYITCILEVSNNWLMGICDN